MSKWFEEEESTEPLNSAPATQSTPADQETEAKRRLDEIQEGYRKTVNKIQYGDWPSETS